jgi:prolyl-tRNA editing enzyme YbaK/EbsC (Cys-tRNA(Pro) deacylase)
MSAVLNSPSVERVRDALSRAGMAPAIVELPGAARTAKAAAEYLGCEVGQIANSLVFRAETSDSALLVMSSGAKRVDVARLAALVGEPVGKADADFVRNQTGFAIGGVPPVGHAEPIRTIVDEDLLLLGDVWAAAGTPNAVFRLDAASLVEITSGISESIK